MLLLKNLITNTKEIYINFVFLHTLFVRAYLKYAQYLDVLSPFSFCSLLQCKAFGEQPA